MTWRCQESRAQDIYDVGEGEKRGIGRLSRKARVVLMRISIAAL